MKLSLKMILAVLTALLLVVMINTNAFATSTPTQLVEDVRNSGNGIMQNTTDLTNMAGKVLKLIRTATVILGTVIIAFLGIKYMMGSVEEKSEYKKSMMPLVIGIIVVMAATSIASLLFGLF